MRLVDFNVATVNGSYACESGISTAAVSKEAAEFFEESDDADVVRLLDAIYMVRRVLASYRANGIREPKIGVCDADAVRRFDRGTSRESTVPIERAQGRCWTGSPAPTDPFEIAGGEFMLQSSARYRAANNRSGEFVRRGDGLPSTANSLPSLDDVKDCVQQCEQCPRCASISVSTASHACLWFSAQVACVNSSELELQTAMQRYVQQPTTKLDHYVSVQVDRRPKPAATNPWRERQMAAWRARVVAERSG